MQVPTAATERAFRLPDLGEGLADAEITTWLVQVGDTITVDQPVVEVETAKAAVEVPAPFAGVVTTLHGTAGDRIAVGAPLITVTTESSAESSTESSAESSAVAATGGGTSGNVLIGYGTSEPKPRRRRPRTGFEEPGVVVAPADTESADVNPPVISPLVRKLARDHRIDLRSLRPSGAQSTITRRDVEAAIADGQPSASGPSGERRIPLRGARRAAAEKLSRSRREIPEATVWVDVDATEFLTARRELSTEESPVSVLALLARFCVLGLQKFPELNARIEGHADDTEIVVHDAIHLGIAAQTPRGLVVPVVRDAQTLTTRQLAIALGERIEAARAGTIAPAEMSGGTFTVNNYGPFGVDGSAAIINHPEVAILGIGRIIDRAWVVDGALAIRKVTELTLAFDHRACDGGVAGGFLRFVADCVEHPIRALGEL